MLEVAIGNDSAGRPLSRDAVVPWFSASKLPATLAVAKAWELGLLHPRDLVADHVPGFSGPGKVEVRIEHLLTHPAPLRAIDHAVGGAIDEGRDARVQRIVKGQADPDWVPGKRAGYLSQAGYLLLDEIVSRPASRSRRFNAHPSPSRWASPPSSVA